MTAVAVLGPLQLTGPDGPIKLASARQRRLLAALAAHLGQGVRSELLVEMVWAGDPAPDDPRGAVQTNVTRLRRLLPPGVGIQTVPAGYRLVADRALVDVTAFADHLDAAGATHDARIRLYILDAALELWRGRPFTELDHSELAAETARLTALRTAATEMHVGALLEVGRVAECVAEAEALCIAEPLWESAVALLMRALVAAGRQCDALAAYARLRTRLADELGLDPGQELRTLEQQVLRQELPVHPPHAEQPAVRTGAPRLPVSSFVGRERDLAAAADRLARSRVVTLCGPGGVGKTRLATHLAAAVEGRYGDGVLFVELGDGGPADVEHTLAAALRMSAGGGSATVTDRIVDVLAVRNQLIVLDNCEHVADVVAPLVEAVTSGVSGVDLLLTSREPVRVDGEQVVRVEPLDPRAAAELLSDRIRAVDRDSAVGEGGADLVPQLCLRLDGLPLALELAAARAPALGLVGLLEALDRPLDVLRGGRRGAAPRHRSLRDVIEWSVGLLDDGQRGLFEEMSVFAGPVELGSIARVCSRADALPDLVDRSLVRRFPGEPARFGMLETVRAFGRSMMAARPAGTALRVRHARWAVHLAEDIAAARQGPGEADAVRRFDAHVADLRRAHLWLCASGPMAELLGLSRLFAELGYLRGRIDLTRMVEQALTVAGILGRGPAPPAGSAHPQVPRLLGLLATAHWQHGELELSERHARHAIELAAACGDPNQAAVGHEALANVMSFRGDLVAALEHSGRSRDLARAGADLEVELLALVDMGLGCIYAGDDAGAARHESEVAALAGELGSPTALAWSHYLRGERRAERGDPEAVRHLAAAVRAAERVDSAFVAGIARHTLLTSSARRSTDPGVALGAFGPLIDHWHASGAGTQLWIAIRALAATLSRLGRHRDVATLLGAASASPLAPRPFGADEAREQEVVQAARDALGGEFDD
ncbi:MAG: winged helix-turn-helix domain-containing protein, partial [Pseudonocardia sp.]|nr:winged helix-turn-helix domain-containing protein [Pseudonocardia sp.]